jgi:hypothetical protein
VPRARAQATTNPYLLDFLGLMPPALSFGHPGTDGQAAPAGHGHAAAAYRPVVVAVELPRPSSLQGKASPLRSTSAEHKSSMSKHYSADALRYQTQSGSAQVREGCGSSDPSAAAMEPVLELPDSDEPIE